MKRIVFIVIILLSAFSLQAQKDTAFYKHELRASLGPSLVSNLWVSDETMNSNFSVAYFYRPNKGFWTGINFISIFGDKIYYHWREYNNKGSFKDFSKSKIKYCAVIAPEIKFSYFYQKAILLYGALSGGVAFECGYDNKKQEFPKKIPYFHLTYFGLSCKFGKNNNIFLGGELGIGCKGLISMQGGYRF